MFAPCNTGNAVTTGWFKQRCKFQRPPFQKSRNGAAARARRMASKSPSMFAGHSVLCPYDRKSKTSCQGQRTLRHNTQGKMEGAARRMLCRGLSRDLHVCRAEVGAPVLSGRKCRGCRAEAAGATIQPRRLRLCRVRASRLISCVLPPTRIHWPH